MNTIKLPLIIEITNITEKPINDLDILSLKNSEMIKVKNFDLTYQQLTDYLKNNTINVNKTYVRSSNRVQMFELLQFKNRTLKVNLFPDIERIRLYDDVIEFKHEAYTMDKDSSLIISQLRAYSTLSIFFY